MSSDETTDGTLVDVLGLLALYAANTALLAVVVGTGDFSDDFKRE
jgi:hypothetical protein